MNERQWELKLSIRVSPRTVGKYLGECPRREPDPSQRWLTFVHNHAQAMLACDFFVVFTARFRILYVLVIMELGRRQILHYNVTAHPSAEWALQQFRRRLRRNIRTEGFIDVWRQTDPDHYDRIWPRCHACRLPHCLIWESFSKPRRTMALRAPRSACTAYNNARRTK